MARLLIIDDDELMRQSLCRLARRSGHECEQAESFGQGQEMVRQGRFDLIFLDVRLPDGNGLDLLGRIGCAADAPEVIIMTGFGDPCGAELAIRSGAWDYIEKTFSVKEITLSLERALQYRREKQAVQRKGRVSALRREGIIGQSPPLKACLDQVAQAAGTDLNVLITGETGTGKELFARAVHANSARSRGPFVVVDCTALPETLVESLLFGHEKGTFTGAEKQREGLVRQAHCGTLFLDEVGDLAPAVQKIFLRVLQERRFRPLGAQKETESDFRLVAATHRHLEARVEQGLFRQDLLYRLCSFALELPALRLRLEDIPELARYHVDRLCSRYGLAPKGFAPELIATLCDYDWPGNVREFVHCIERTLAAARLEPTLYPLHLPPHLRASVRKASLSPRSAPDTAAAQAPALCLPSLQQYRDQVYNDAERRYLQDLMDAAGRNIPEACRVSGLSQSRLYALLKKHHLGRIL